MNVEYLVLIYQSNVSNISIVLILDRSYTIGKKIESYVYNLNWKVDISGVSIRHPLEQCEAYHDPILVTRFALKWSKLTRHGALKLIYEEANPIIFKHFVLNYRPS